MRRGDAERCLNTKDRGVACEMMPNKERKDEEAKKVGPRRVSERWYAMLCYAMQCCAVDLDAYPTVTVSGKGMKDDEMKRR